MTLNTLIADLETLNTTIHFKVITGEELQDARCFSNGQSKKLYAHLRKMERKHGFNYADVMDVPLKKRNGGIHTAKGFMVVIDPNCSSRV